MSFIFSGVFIGVPNFSWSEQAIPINKHLSFGAGSGGAPLSLFCATFRMVEAGCVSSPIVLGFFA